MRAFRMDLGAARAACAARAAMCLLLCAGAPAVAAAPDARAVQDGKLKSDNERCQECHGSTGQGPEHPGPGEDKFARLAGQSVGYIEKQIRDFRSGARKDDVMAMMANSIDDADLADIAAYFSAQATMQGQPGAADVLGGALYMNGDAARQIPACAACHGAPGKGLVVRNAGDPVLKGQARRYLDKQLRDWRSGARHNSPGGVMNQAAKALSDADIVALANYLSTR